MIVSSKTRWLAIATGSLVGVAGSVGLGLGFALGVASFLVVGALVQPRFPQAGRGLICAGALWLSAWVFMVGFFMLTEWSSATPVLPELITLACCALLAVCDGMIVSEEFKIRRFAIAKDPLKQNASSNA